MRIWTGILCWLCLAGPAPAQTIDGDDLERARALGRAGRHAEAIPLYEGLMGEVERRDGETSWSLVVLAHELAVQHHSLGNTAAAVALYRRSLVVAEGHRGGRDAALVPSLRGLAAIAAMQGQLGDAEAFYRRAVEIQESGDDSGLARTLAELGLLCQLQERLQDAEELYRRALEVGDGKDLSGNEVATIAGNLAALYALQGRDDEAETYYRRALDIREGALGPEHPDLVKNLQELARLDERQHRFAEAASLYERILRIREQAEPNDLALSDALSRLAANYLQLGRSREAEMHFRMARAILNAQCGGGDPAPGCRQAIRVHQELKDRPVSVAVPALPAEPPRPAASETPAALDPAPAASPGPPSPPPPPKAAVGAPAPAATVRIYRAQVAARQDQGEAAELLERLLASHSDFLGDIAARFVRADLGDRGVWHRVQIGEFPSATRARAFCAELTRRGHEGCWVIATETGGDR